MTQLEITHQMKQQATMVSRFSFISKIGSRVYGTKAVIFAVRPQYGLR